MTGANGAAVDPYAASYPRGPLLRRTSPLRAVLFMAINLLVYGMATAFVHYLSSGEWLSRTSASYQQSVSRPLGDMFMQPLSVLSHPWMILVGGLLLAGVIIVPLLVACLYHSRFCALFLVCVAVLAHSPVLTLVLAAGCVLVAATPLRRRNPGQALLCGLAPVCVYLYLSCSPSSVVLAPMQQLVLYLPFVIAAGGAILAGAVVLLIAHCAKYRPGVIWPVLAVLVAAPLWMFYQHIGPDELAFSILTSRLTPSEGVFANEPFHLEVGHESVSRQSRDDVLERLQERKAAMVAECDAFLARYDESHRAPDVLWLKGVTLDTQVSLRSMTSGLLRYYDEFPLPASASTWARLVERFGRHGCSAVGRLRLAHLAGRAGEIETMREHLDAAAALLVNVHVAIPQVRRKSAWEHLFTPVPPLPSQTYLQRVAHDVDKLRWVMDRNAVADDPEAAAAFGAYIALDRRRYSREDFSDRIMVLLERYVDTPFADNLQLVEMQNVKDARNRAMLLAVLENDPDSDASIEANFELGLLAMETDSVEGLSRILQRPEVYFRRVISAISNPWQRQANEHLAKLTLEEGATGR